MPLVPNLPLLRVNEKSIFAFDMPLPNLRRRCLATARSTGKQCLNPAAFGCKTCRVHGAWNGARSRVGSTHPRYKHGRRTSRSIDNYRAAMSRLQNIERIGYLTGLLEGRRVSGRKTEDRQIPLRGRSKRTKT